MITFDQFKKVMEFDTQGKHCIEIEFSVADSEKFSWCWMGKMPDKTADSRDAPDVYWYGLTPDGKNAHNFFALDDMLSAKVFDGQSFAELWDRITFLSVNSCEPQEMFLSYLP